MIQKAQEQVIWLVGIGMWLILSYPYKVRSEGVDTLVRRPSRTKTV